MTRENIGWEKINEQSRKSEGIGKDMPLLLQDTRELICKKKMRCAIWRNEADYQNGTKHGKIGTVL